MTNEELTWQDIKRIVEIADRLIAEEGPDEWAMQGEEAYYTEVLKRFKEKEK